MDVPPSRTSGYASRLRRPKPASPVSIRNAIASGEPFTDAGERCPTCHDTVQRRFCGRCGAQAPGEFPSSVGAFLRRSVSRLVDADSRLLRSLRLLFAKPGRLTVHYLQGNRTRYIGPVQLFALVNVVIVLLGVSGVMSVFNTSLRYHVSATSFYHQEMAERWVHAHIDAPEGWTWQQAIALKDSLQRADNALPENSHVPNAPSTTASLQVLASFQEYEERFDRRAQQLSESLVFLLIPMLVVFFWIADLQGTGPRPGQGLLVHLVQATHVTTVWLLALPLAAIITVMSLGLLGSTGAIGEEALRSLRDPVWTLSSCVGVAVYIIVSVRHVYRRSWAGAVLQGAVIGFLLVPCLQVYRAILFVVGFYTT